MAVQVARLVLNLLAIAVLGRLLMPEDFGLIAMVTAVTGLAAVFRNLGLADATVQRDGLTEEQASGLFWINACFGLVLTLLLAAMSPLVAWFYGDARLTLITVAISTAFVFSGLAIQHRALLRRQMKFRHLAQIDLAVAFLAPATAVALAWGGAGYWSLVSIPVTTAVFSTLLVLMSYRWKPGVFRRGVGLRSLVSYGGYVTGFNLINYFARNLDNILIGKVWGDVALGLYSRAYSLLTLPLTQISVPLIQVAMPALSRLQKEPQRFARFYLRTLNLIVTFTFPISALLLLRAEEVILIMLGPQWTGAVPIFQFLAISAFVQPMCNSTGMIYRATDRTRQEFQWGLIGSLWLILVIAFGVPFGTQGVALAYSLGMLIQTVPCFWFAMRQTEIAFRGVLIAASRPALATAAGALVVLGLDTLWTASLPVTLNMATGGGLFLAVYLSVLLMRKQERDQYVYVLRELRPGKPKSSPGDRAVS